MIYISGKKGSGKSYYSVDYIIKNRDRYSFIYSNINGIKSKELGIKNLNFDKLLKILYECKNIFDNASIDIDDDMEVLELDKKIIEYLLSIEFLVENPKYSIYLANKKDRDNTSFFRRFFLDILSPIKEEVKYKDILIMIDECYQHFGNRTVDDILKFLVSYSRHLYIDLVLISQDPSDIHRDYLKRVEEFIHAIPISRQLLGGSFKYKKHVSYPFRDGYTDVGTFLIPKSQKVFNYYESGGKVRSSSIFFRYIVYFIILLLFFIFVFGSLFDFFNDKSKNSSISKVDNTTHNISNSNHFNKKPIIKKEKIKYSNYTYLTINCIDNNCISYQDKNIKFDFDVLDDLLNNTLSKQIKIYDINNFQKTIILLVTKDFIDLFKKDNSKMLFKI